MRQAAEVSLRGDLQQINRSTRHVKRCVWPECREPLSSFRIGPLCMFHAWAIYEAVERSDALPVTDARLAVSERRKAERDRQQELARTRGQLPGWIYYIRTDGKVKIGYSADVRQRMRSYPPESELLAVHPGTRNLEADMHRRFVGSRAAGREWFRETPDLTEHIAQVVAQFGDPVKHRYHFGGTERMRTTKRQALPVI